MPRFDHFGLVAPLYDRIFGGLKSPRLRELLALPAGRLLDVGGGTGRVVNGFVDGVDEAVLCDVSRGMLSEARGKTGLRLVRGLAERLPFPDGAFDRVVVVDAFHHFADQGLAARELLRVVAPGGRVVVQDLNIERLPVKLVALGEGVLFMGSRFYGPRGLRDVFDGLGARVSVVVEGALDLFLVAEKP